MTTARLTILALAALALPGAAQAQRVTADIAIGGGPVHGHIVVGDHYPHYTRTVVVVRPRYRPVHHDVIVIRGHRGHGWWHRHGYRTVRFYYDGHRHYERAHRPGLRTVVVYERGGRYYQDGPRDYDGRDDYGRRDRWDDDDDRNDYRRRVAHDRRDD